MLIKETAKHTGLTERAIRFYEEAGLIRPALNASRFREYSAADIQLLRQIAVLRNLGFTLEEIHLFRDHPEQIHELLTSVRDRQKTKADRAQGSEVLLSKLLESGEPIHSPENWMPLHEPAAAGSKPVPAIPISSGKVRLIRKNKIIGGFNMSESKMSSIAWIVGLGAIILSVVLAVINLVNSFANNLPHPIWNSLLIIAALGVPGICAIALAEVLDNQAILHQQNQRTQLFLMEMAGDESDIPADGIQAEKALPKTWKCPQCSGLNEAGSLFCRHCNALRDMRAK